MGRRKSKEHADIRQVGPDAPADAASPGTRSPRLFVDRWYGKLILLLVGTILLTLAYAPFYQFWAAWIGLVPLIVVTSRTKGTWRAAFWGWLAGVLFFSANVWWLLTITGPGVIALVFWLGIYWAVAAAVLRPIVRTVTTAATGIELADTTGDHEAMEPNGTVASLRLLLVFPVLWVGAEWVRGNWPFYGFSWFNLSYSQTPVLHLCQIADLLGEHGISFWVAMINALAALFIFNGWRFRGLLRPVLVVCGVLVAVGIYGVWRFAQTESHLLPGPTVLLVQPNIPQSNSGDKGAPMEDLIDFHVAQTNAAMKERPDADLAVWSETMMPEMNAEFAASMASLGLASRDAERAKREIAQLARRYKVSLLVGGSFAGRVKLVSTDPRMPMVEKAGRRNSAYYFLRDTGELADRFDKIHLVPFGEYIPFEESFPWLYRQLIALGPPNMEDYQLDRGERAKIFLLPKDRQPATQPVAADKAWRFVTSICFEDADADLNAWHFRGGGGRGSVDAKQADFIVNISNDGWFKLTMMPQHFQVATLRSIENRVPTVRSVNTGISGFIDSLGRSRNDLVIPANTEGTLASSIMLDSRTTFFTRWGNWIGPGCALGLGLVGVGNVVKRRRARRAGAASNGGAA
ncbi:apolipoprotein N-acyltransferase [Humisphaera borealis]|uniref:Apolipoprotein N-acyltransferase n=1 Tax=Humisphaera borealis TaxID=2807512 RepID=A0A7M2WSH0_9BACT|nr:apolipoprotein N-acyltransferase [Humisphaera borealis]QOV87751.1 apolipoprotein N-acyltransferase [Humisphaera borealis]